ncbi:MAG: hypothetical protein QOF12_2181 [Solirubrobacteraceae bacterium]|jgi:hypothetical protein|nr:hypothetical protein [Solirubrobacteraceae bacterium]
MRPLDPLRSEAAMFRVLVAIIVVFVVALVVVEVIRAIT